MREREINDGIMQVRQAFQRAPLNFLDRSSLKAALVNELRSRSERVNVTAERSNGGADYKKHHLDAIVRPGQKIDRVHMDVRAGSPEDEDVIDVAVLTTSPTIHIRDGEKYLPPGSIQHLIAIPYLETENLVQPAALEASFDQLACMEAVSKWLIVASNKNVFQHRKRDGKYYERSQEYREELEEVCEERDINLREIYP